MESTLKLDLQKMALYQIARLIRKDWLNVSPHAKPYLNAMLGLEKVSDSYGSDNGKSIVLYFLSNAATWRGDNAKTIKTHLKSLVK